MISAKELAYGVAHNGARLSQLLRNLNTVKHRDQYEGTIHNVDKYLYDGDYRIYELAPAVVTLVHELVLKQEGKRVPLLVFPREYMSVFDWYDGVYNNIVCAVPTNDPNGTPYLSYLIISDAGQSRRVLGCLSQTPDGRFQLNTDNADAAELAANLYRCHVAAQLIENSHVTNEARMFKTRAKVKGKVVKHKTPYTYTYINVTRNEAAHATTEGHDVAGKKRLHRVRPFLRLKQGKVEYVKGHYRGDASLGVVTSVTRVT